MDLVFVTINEFHLQGDGTILVNSTLSANWGLSRTENDVIPGDIGSNLLTLAKEMVIAWAADPNNGGKTLTEDQVIVVGGIQ